MTIEQGAEGHTDRERQHLAENGEGRVFHGLTLDPRTTSWRW